MSKVSDGNHTITELLYLVLHPLYDHRRLLFIHLCKMMPSRVWVRKNHYEGWDCIMLRLMTGEQISYHVEAKHRVLYMDLIDNPIPGDWDGHTSPDVLKRLEKACRNYV